MDRNGCLQRKLLQKAQICLGEQRPSFTPDRHHTVDLIPCEQRRDQQAFIAHSLCAWDLQGARILIGIVDKFRFALRRQRPDNALAQVDRIRQDGFGDVSLGDQRPQGLSVRLRQIDRAARTVEQFACVCGDPVHYGGEIERG